MYQTEWQNIRFSDIVRVSSEELAGPEFYRAFYEEFFRRYTGWDQLAMSWHQEKELFADFIIKRAGKASKMLSIGSGLGAVERCIRRDADQIDLFIHEVTPIAWRWIDKEFPENRKVLGFVPDCLPAELRFDFAYLSGVDYALDNETLIKMLAGLKSSLARGTGPNLLILGSLEDVEKRLPLLGRGRALAAEILYSVGARQRGQFWGWRRTRDEYRGILGQAGYSNIEDGFVSQQDRLNYWISGKALD
jgi:hypothetical protein